MNANCLVRKFEIFSEENTEICTWDGGKNDGRKKDQVIPEGEEIVGIYGCNNHESIKLGILNFGFITAKY